MKKILNPGVPRGIVDRHVASTRVVRRDVQRLVDTVVELPVPTGNPARPVRPPRVPLGIRSARPAGSPLGSCRIGAGLSSQMAALRPLSSSRLSEASRARRRTPEEPRQTPRSGYRPRRRVGPPRRRIRLVGSHCGKLRSTTTTCCMCECQARRFQA